jgi:hypothetical protein
MSSFHSSVLSASHAGRLAVRFFVIWAILALVLLIFGAKAIGALLPLLASTIDILQRDFVVTLQISHDSGEWMLRMQPLVVSRLELTTNWIIPPGAQLGWFSVHLDHILVPALLFLTVLGGWPVTGRREAGVRVMLGVPTLLVGLTIITSVHLIALVQMFLVNSGMKHGATFNEPWVVTGMIFLESGGRWLLPLVAAAGCVGIARSLSGFGADALGLAHSRSTVENAKSSYVAAVDEARWSMIGSDANPRRQNNGVFADEGDHGRST